MDADGIWRSRDPASVLGGVPDGPSAEGPFLLAIRAGCGVRVLIRAVRQFIHDVVANLLPDPLRRSGWGRLSAASLRQSPIERARYGPAAAAVVLAVDEGVTGDD
jgi:hypothetical protein